MDASICTYLQDIKNSFQDFMNHELISKDPFSLSDEKILDGIRERSNMRAEHRCELINRMNTYCTLVSVSGHRLIPTGYNTAKYGVFHYVYNNTAVLEILYSTFKYPHIFCDEGLVRDSSGGSGKEFFVTFDIINGNKRQSVVVKPESIFENSSNIGSNIFLEYTLEGTNKFGSIKFLPSFVNIDETIDSFIDEVRKSLLKTKFVLLALVERYPAHLMHEVSIEILKNPMLKSEFRALYEQDLYSVIKDSLADARLMCEKKEVRINIPY